MDEWSGLRTFVIIAVWLTVLGGAVLATAWIAGGGARAVGPEDELMARAGSRPPRRSRKVTSFSSAQVGMHALLALLTAATLTRAAALDDDRTGGYIAVAISLLVTAIPGVLMFRKWRSGERPDVSDLEPAPARRRAEDRLPRVVVYAHGAAAVLVLVGVVALVFVD